ncbi:hypothetical protein LTS18_000513, partial [Coniosporium uncinatum]
MDVDTVTNGNHPAPLTSQEVPEDDDSPMADEPPLLSTLSIGMNKELQSNAVRDLKRNTTLKRLDPPGAVIGHTSWDPDSENTMVLYTGGEDASFLHVVPTSSSGGEEITSISQPIDYPSYTVTATAFALESQMFLGVCGSRFNEKGESMSEYKILMVTPSSERVVGHPADMVFTLRWNSQARSCLAVMSNGQSSDVWIWEERHGVFRTLFPGSALSTAILDAVWLSPSEFALCGQDWIREYVIVDGEAQEQVEYNSLFTHQLHGMWDRVRYEPNSHVIAVATTVREDSDVLVGLVARKTIGDTQTGILTSADVKGVTDIRFQPIPNPAGFSP